MNITINTIETLESLVQRNEDARKALDAEYKDLMLLLCQAKEREFEKKFHLEKGQLILLEDERKVYYSGFMINHYWGIGVACAHPNSKGTPSKKVFFAQIKDVLGKIKQ